MHTVGKVAKQFGLSRSTLLYYDSIGLLVPSGRSEANYRLYSDRDIDKLRKIMLYREAGLPLGEVAGILSGNEGGHEVKNALENRLDQINHEIKSLRSQQQVILRLLGHGELVKQTRILTKESWVSLLVATGLSDEDMGNWHIEFERMAPEAHQDFLESLGLTDDEIEYIRSRSRPEE